MANGLVDEQEVNRTFASKREWHRQQARLPLREKVAILLKMQKDYYPILQSRGKLQPWQKPWNVRP